MRDGKEVAFESDPDLGTGSVSDNADRLQELIEPDRTTNDRMKWRGP
jgi:hypothetical protein